MKHLRRVNPLVLWIGILLLMAVPFTQVFGHGMASEEADDDAEIVLATGRASADVVLPGRAIVSARGNHMLVDSPTPLGGPNETFNPLDAFLTGMLTCAVFIYETAAAELDIPLNSISASMEADFAVQGLIDGSVDPRIREFRLSLDLDGPTAEEADLLREQYKLRCPLYTTLILAAPIEVIHEGLDVAAPSAFSYVELPIDNASDTLQIVQMKLAFEPDAWTPPHVHGGQTIVTVLDGEIVNNTFDILTTYGPAEGWTEQPDVPHMAGNDSDEIAHVIVSYAAPEDAAMTTMVEGMVEGDLPPGPTAVLRGDMVAMDVPEEFTLLQLVVDFPPGSWTPLHSHGGDVLITVLEGEITFYMDGEETTFVAGESWIEYADERNAKGNETDSHAQIGATFVLPVGATPTTYYGEVER